METNIVICPDCRRVIAVGAGLPATCFAAIPLTERETPLSQLEQHPFAHKRCVDLAVLAPAGVEGDRLIETIETLYAEQIKALSDAMNSAIA